uniref:Adenosine 5'-monophosphoramidase HINT3 n=2 Tax=Ascaris TaxID=6251 RepID=A0A0M3I5E5_ASCLU
MATGLQGCTFCEIVHVKKDRHLKESENAIVIADIAPHAPHHYLILSKRHINKPADLTPADIDLVKEMEQVGREYLREVLKTKGEADIVEDMLRVGFHGSAMISVRHLHMHLLYPIKEMSMVYRSLIFRPGPFFHLTKDVVEQLEKRKNPDGKTDMERHLEGNPAVADLDALPDDKVHAAVVTNLGTSAVG